MEERTGKESDNSIIIGNASNFWRYSPSYGFDLTRQNDHGRCSAISLQTSNMPIIIDPKRSALVIIDMQNFFIHPAVRAHDTGLAASEKLLEYAIPAARKAGIQIIWLNWGLTDEDIDQAPPALKRTFARSSFDDPKNVQTPSKTIYTGLGSEIGNILLPSGENINAGKLLMRGTWNTKLYDPLFESYESSQKTAKPDQWFHKDRISGLWSHQSPLLSYLRDNNITTLFFAGVNTDQCVSGTFNDAYSKGFDCILLRDGCGTLSPSFAREYVEHDCTRAGGGFMMDVQQLAAGVNVFQQGSS